MAKRAKLPYQAWEVYERVFLWQSKSGRKHSQPRSLAASQPRSYGTQPLILILSGRDALCSRGGAERWATLESIVNTAKLHELDPQVYLTDVLEPNRLRGNQEPSAARAARLELEGGPPARCADRCVSPRHHKASSMTAAAMPIALLERWLRAHADQHPAATNLPMLDGHLAAIVAGPMS
ncbi:MULTISPECIES: hypothetical protein [unclassified Bradyrhizobium]|uniref:hypothetical protein n=1 Tax=unclassified Bradyrhizobium TaxID=2631580 RepID=UPI003399946B